MRHFSELSPAASRLVDAAEGLVQHQGYNGFSYEDVSALTGIKKPTVHYHFPKKEELVAMVAQRYVFRHRQKLLEIEGQAADPLAQLEAYAVLFGESYGSSRRLCLGAMLSAESESVPATVVTEAEEFFRVNLRWLAEVFKVAQERGQIDQSQPADCLAESYLCALEGAMVVGRALQCSRGPAAVGRTMLAVMRAAP